MDRGQTPDEGAQGLDRDSRLQAVGAEPFTTPGSDLEADLRGQIPQRLRGRGAGNWVPVWDSLVGHEEVGV